MYLNYVVNIREHIFCYLPLPLPSSTKPHSRVAVTMKNSLTEGALGPTCGLVFFEAAAWTFNQLQPRRRQGCLSKLRLEHTPCSGIIYHKLPSFPDSCLLFWIAVTSISRISVTIKTTVQHEGPQSLCDFPFSRLDTQIVYVTCRVACFPVHYICMLKHKGSKKTYHCSYSYNSGSLYLSPH